MGRILVGVSGGIAAYKAVELVRLATGAGHSVRVVQTPASLNFVGRATFDKGLDTLAPRGLMALFGQASGPVPPFDPALLNQKGSLYLTRPTLMDYTATRDELLASAGALFDVVRKGAVKVTIGQTFPLEKAADAHRALESRNTVGSSILIP